MHYLPITWFFPDIGYQTGAFGEGFSLKTLLSPADKLFPAGIPLCRITQGSEEFQPVC